MKRCHRAEALPSLLRTAIAASAILVLVGKAPNAAGGERAPAAGQSAGMTVHIDPATGKFLSAPARQPVPQVPAASARQSTDLPVVAGDTPAGGITVDLAGRFRQVMTATKRPDGSITIDCSPDGASARPAP
jgi:hypothetical protein